MFAKLFVAGVVMALTAGGALGMMIDTSGNITDWGVHPFSLPNQENYHNGNVWGTIENNYAPLNYPGVGRVPSPGLGAGGEAFDLEEMYVRATGSHLIQALIVTSSPLSKAWGSDTLYLGDLFLTIGNEKFGIVTQSANTGLAAGSIYRIESPGDTVSLQHVGSSYYGRNNLVANDYGANATVADITGPWAVSNTISASQRVGAATLYSATHNYGGSENGTFLMEYSLDPSLLGLSDPAVMVAKITWGCGNDVIRSPTSGATVVPEPATLVLVAAGAVLCVTARRRRSAPAV